MQCEWVMVNHVNVQSEMKDQMQTRPCFFNILKDSNKPLWDECTNHSKLSVIAQIFTIKSDHIPSEAGYDKIIE